VTLIDLVGTLPVAPREGESPTTAAVRYALDHVGDRVGEVPAEGTDRKDWIIPILRRREANPNLITLKRSRYEKVPMTIWSGSGIYYPKPGRPLTSETLSLHYAAYAREAYTTLVALTADTDPRKRLKVGVPGPFDVAAMAWGPWALARYQDEVTAALTELALIHAFAGDRATYQLELPVPTYLVAKTPLNRRASVAEWFGKQIGAFIARTPVGSRWFIHLCVGNPHDFPLITLDDTGPLTDLTTAINQHWPAGTHHLDVVHMPFGDSQHPAPATEKYYRSLRGLVLLPGTELSAGLADALVPLSQQRAALGAATDAAGRALRVSTQCGEGRRPQLLDATMDRLLELSTGGIA
jgi:hypothetical protein